MAHVADESRRNAPAARIDSLPLSNRTLRRLEEARITTVDELASRPDSDLLAIPGFGHTCLREVRAVLQVHRAAGGENLSSPGADRFPELDLPGSLLESRIGDLPIPNRARSVFHREGIVTVRDFVSAGPARILGLRNFGAVTLHDVNRVIHSAARTIKDGESYAPLLQVPRVGDRDTEELSRVSLTSLDLPRRARRACLELGIRTLKDFVGLDMNELLVRRNFGQATLRRIQREVERFIEGLPSEQRGFAGYLDSLFARLQDKERRLIDLREGRDGSDPLTLGETGAILEITESRACQIEHAAWSKLRRFAAGSVEPIADAVKSSLLEHGGLAPPDRLLARAPFAQCGLDPKFLGRILARLLPHHLARLADGRLAAVPAATLCSLATRLRKRLRRGGTSQTLAALTVDVGRGLDLGVHAETLVRALCENMFRREIAADSDGTLRVRTPAQGLGDDLAAVLEASDGPMHFTEIARRLPLDADAEKVRLRLCRDERFVLVGRGMYELARRFEVPEPIRDRVARLAQQKLEESGRPTSVALLHRALTTDPSLAETSEFVVAKVLREDRRFRHLGRGSFGLASRDQENVAHVSDLLKDILEEAGGPLSYAELRKRVQERRRVSDGAISATLVGRDTFLRVARGWFDLASRHPLDETARRKIGDAARDHLAAHGGVAALDDLASALHAHLPDGASTTGVLLGDILRRMGGFSFVSGGFVREADDRRLEELERRAVDSLREAGDAMRPSSLARRLGLDAAATALLKEVLKGSARVESLGDGRYRSR